MAPYKFHNAIALAWKDPYTYRPNQNKDTKNTFPDQNCFQNYHQHSFLSPPDVCYKLTKTLREREREREREIYPGVRER